MYVTGQLLALDQGDNIQRIQQVLGGVRRVDLPGQSRLGDLAVLRSMMTSTDMRAT